VLYDWLGKLTAANFDLTSLKSKSRKPHSSPNQTPANIEDLVVSIAKEFGNSDIIVACRLLREHGKKLAHSTVCKILKPRKISNKYRTTKKSEHTKRYVAAAPLDRTQIDTADLEITDPYCNRVYFVAMIDDHSKVVKIHVNNSKGVLESLACLEKFIEKYGMPALLQSDNGTEFTNKYVSENNPKRQKAARLGAFELELQRLGIRHHLIKPGTPELNGKIERFNQTIKRELSRHLRQGMTLEQIIAKVAWYEDYYNNRRPHTELNGLTPHEKFYGKRLTKLAA
jgi:transposase InsO family protein